MRNRERWDYLTGLAQEYVSELEKGYGVGTSLEERLKTRSARQCAIANEIIGGVQGYLYRIAHRLLKGNVKIYRFNRPRYFNLQGLDLCAEDLVQETSLRLIERFHTYDPSEPIEKWLHLYGTVVMHRAGLTSAGIIRLPSDLMVRSRRVLSSCSTDAELFRSLVPPKINNPSTVYRRGAYMRLALTNEWDDIFSLSNNGGDKRTYEERFVPDEMAEERILSHTERSLFRRHLEELLDGLTLREREIIVERYNLYGNESRSLQSIADKYGVSCGHIRNIETSSLKKLRKRLQSGALKDL